MANCSRCGAYISSGDKCSDCENNTYLVDTFTSYANSLNRRQVENASRSSSYDDDDDDSYSSSSYSSGDSYYIDQRNGFVSFLFGVVIGLGVCLTVFLVYQKLAIDNVYILTGVIFGSLLAGFIIALVAWRNKKNILFIVMLALAIPGYISLVQEIQESKKGAKTEQSTTQ